MSDLVLGCALGIALGARHALEPDHLAALATVVASRPGPRRAAVSGMSWGVGHTATLLVVGGLCALLSAAVPAWLSGPLERAVGVMLIVLGIGSLVRARRPNAAAPSARRPILIGIVHGLAGSGAMVALAMATMPSRLGALVFIAVFGIGTIAGMGMTAAVAGWPLAGLRGRLAWLQAAAGVLSMAVGVFWLLRG